MLKELLGLQGKVGIEAVKENLEKDVINRQVQALEITLVSQIEDNEGDLCEINELQEELERMKEQLEERNKKYEKLLEVLC